MYPSGTKLDANGFPFEQDRSLDPDTAAWFCVGCPWKSIVNQSRGSGIPSNPNTSNKTEFSSSATTGSGVYRKTRYVCTSPKATYVQASTQEHSTIGFAFCPFLEQKLALLQGGDGDV